MEAPGSKRHPPAECPRMQADGPLLLLPGQLPRSLFGCFLLGRLGLAWTSAELSQFGKVVARAGFCQLPATPFALAALADQEELRVGMDGAKPAARLRFSHDDPTY
jgi:hypothetical protein